MYEYFRMCYNKSLSITFFIIGILSIIYINLFNKKLEHTGIHLLLLFYSFMELLQSIQYNYVNQCDNNTNKYLTEIAYILVLFQPLIWNIYFYKNSNSCDQQVFTAAICLAIIWMTVNVAARIMKSTDEEQQKSISWFGGQSSCTKKNTSHLFWEWRSANFGEMRANYLMYLMIWFIPALCVAKHRSTSLILIASAIVGAFMSYYSGEPIIFTSAWCYFSVPIVLLVILNLL